MSIFSKAINKIGRFVMQIPRANYYSNMRKGLLNKNPTIISSDCFGGLVYHNLGIQFRSPTVNLYFSKEDFIIFVRNLEGFLNAELKEQMDNLQPFPVGTLEYNGEKITVNFMHYKTFESAREKWDERKKRVDYSNIYIIQTIQSATESDITAFNSLPYKNKMLITDKNPINSDNVTTHKILSKPDYRSGEILKYKGIFSVSRYMDDIDYIGFLNKGM